MKWLKQGRQLVLFVLLIASTTFIIYKLYQFNHWDSLFIGYSKSISLISILLFLLCFNIFFESKKWQILLSKIVRVDILTSVKMVLSGFTSGIFTPFRVGEPIGRLAYLENKHWKYAGMLSYFGGALQNIVILFGGLIGMLFYPDLVDITNLIITNTWLWVIFGITLIIGVVILGSKYIPRIILEPNKLKNIGAIISKETVLLAFFYSVLRYLTFSLQLYLCLHYLGGLSYNESYIFIIFIYYLLVSLFPSHLLVDVGIRGSVALFLFDGLGLNAMVVLASVFFVWLINQVLPSLIGAYALVSEKDKSILKNTH